MSCAKCLACGGRILRNSLTSVHSLFGWLQCWQKIKTTFGLTVLNTYIRTYIHTKFKHRTGCYEQRCVRQETIVFNIPQECLLLCSERWRLKRAARRLFHRFCPHRVALVFLLPKKFPWMQYGTKLISENMLAKGTTSGAFVLLLSLLFLLFVNTFNAGSFSCILHGMVLCLDREMFLRPL